MSHSPSIPFIENEDVHMADETDVGKAGPQPSVPIDPQANSERSLTTAIGVNSSVAFAYERKLDIMAKELARTIKDQQMTNSQWQTAQRNLERSEQRANRAALEAKTLREKLETTLSQQAEIRAQNTEAQEKLRKAETELRGLKIMLATHNESSDTDVSRLLDALNVRIEDFATTSARDWLNRRGQFRHHPATENTHQHVRDRLGNQLSSAILQMTPDHEFAPLILQFGWQAVIVWGVRWILRLFSLDTPSAALDDLRSQDRLYYVGLSNQVMEGEVQAVYGHWRALTHRYLRERLPDHDKRTRIDDQVHIILEDCYRIVIMFFNDGCPSKEEFFEESFGAVAEIVTHAVQLATMMKEDIVTRNYEPYVPKETNAFDPRFMEVEEGEGTTKSNDVVSCTLQLGLMYTAKEGHRASKVTSAIFLKARVLTASELDGLFPQSPAHQHDGRQARGEFMYRNHV